MPSGRMVVPWPGPQTIPNAVPTAAQENTMNENQTTSALDLSITLEHLSVTAKNLSQILATPDFRTAHPDAAKTVETALMIVLSKVQ
jgi:hypothetical protein